MTKYHLTSAKARKTLLLRAKAARHRSKSTNAAEADFLAHPPAFLEEEYSSGDDDDYEDVALGNPSLTAGGYNPGGNNNSNTRGRGGAVEPYFIPTLPESASQSGSGGKLPFNYRKLRYFDDVTAGDRGTARNWLRGEIAKAKQLRVRKLLHPTEGANEDEEESLLEAMQHFPHELTPEMNAALLLEGLALNPLESLEGLSKCYDGIVSAGLALLENNNDVDNNNNESATLGSANTKKLSKDEIISALEPLLITTLDPTSGEAIRQLSLLKKYCGTKRYQRRFVQRIAPYLVRPPSSAVWCLRHQNDIEPIIAATEMILDASDDLFSVGWVERGKALEKDSQRAEKLRLAVGQLRKSNSPTEGLLSGLGQMGSSRRGSSSFGSGGRRDHIIHDQLAEWELVSIDKQIRQSVSDLFTKDWSRITALNLSPVESDSMAYGARRRSFAKKAEWSSSHEGAGSAGGAATNSTLTKRLKIPLSPRATTAGGQIGQVIPSADALESTFGPSFSSQDIDSDDNRPLSPPNYSSAGAPLSPTREAGRLTTPKTPPHDRDIEHPSSPGAYRTGLAPLSPGNASSTSDGALSSRSVTGPTGNRDQYRALTSTAAERKRTVAACRALRAQITKFEESFFQMHGRPPKGTAERAPLASTYTQYREWKRAIRADAACRIQALFRGSLLRSKMARSVDPRVSRIVAARRLRIQRIDRKSEHLSHLSIPLDIGSDHHDSFFDAGKGTDTKSRLEVRTTSRDSNDGVEMVMKSNATISPGLSSRKYTPSQPAHHSPGSQNSNSSRSKTINSLPDVTEMSLPELQQRKRELKQQLKMYDLNFHAQHGRMPEKREKEPIRHLYESYNAYKNQITVIEKGEARPGPGTAAFRGRDTVVSPPKAPPVKEISHDRLSPSTQSPISNSQSPEGTPSPKNDFINNANEAPKNSSSDDAIPHDLTSLKAEKATLHQMLRSYEKDFFKQHKRQVSSFSDIKPVAGQYRRYKEIKKAIAQLSDK